MKNAITAFFKFFRKDLRILLLLVFVLIFIFLIFLVTTTPVQTSDKSRCHKVEDGALKADCLEDVVKETGEEEICNDIRNMNLGIYVFPEKEWINRSLEGLADSEVRYSRCMMSVSEVKSDLNKCESIPIDSIKDVCIFRYAIAQEDTSICKLLSYPTDEAVLDFKRPDIWEVDLFQCVINIARDTQDVRKCTALEDLELINRCEEVSVNAISRNN